MELRHLRYFVAVAEELQFTRAAAKLHIAQPPLSQQIRQLERELGVVLFIRSRTGVRLTDAGRALLDGARQALQAADDAAASAQRAGRGEVGRVVVGFGGSVAIDVLSKAVGAHRTRFPGVRIELHELSTSAQINGLLRGELHVGLLRDRVRDDRLKVELLRREPLVAVLPDGHRLAQRTRVAIRDLAHEGFILAPRNMSSSYTDVVLNACTQAGFVPTIVQEGSETLTVLGLVAAGVGVSLLPASVTSVRTSGVVYRPVRTRTATIELIAAWRRDDPSALVAAFLDSCRAAIATGITSPHPTPEGVAAYRP